MNYKNITLGLILLITLVSCHKNDRYGIDSADKIKIEIKRFDKAVIGIDTINIKSEVRNLYETYPDFMSDYIAEIIGENPLDTIKVQGLLCDFLKDTSYVEVNKKVLKDFADISSIEKDVSVAFTGIKHLFPEIKLPEVYFFVSGFNRAILQGNNYIAVGTDLYLGSDYQKYSEITYKYLTVNMRRESVPVDIVAALMYKSFPMNPNEDKLLDKMIYNGKILFLLSLLLPENTPDLIIGYSKTNIEWCNKYEKEIWSSIIEHKHLFSTDTQLINKYINDSPFTSPISQESPGRLATWIGWRIVESYMKSNNSIGIRELMKNKNSQEILENSGYQP